MRRYWIEPENITGDQVHFVGETYHHIVDVCRQLPPARFEVLVAPSSVLLVEMTELRRSQRNPEAFGRIIEARILEPLPRPHLHLVLCVGRFPVMEAVIEKAVEMGVASVHFAFSEFSFVRDMEKISGNRWQRWEKIVRMATQQTGRAELMPLVPPRALIEIVRENFGETREAASVAPSRQGLFFYEGTGQSLREWVSAHPNYQKASDIWLFVGAEGGFSQNEVVQFSSSGMWPVSLGSQVLRVETACVSVVSVLKYLCEL